MYEHSDCCNAPVSIIEDEDWNGDTTKYHVCSRCDKPCDSH